jgi:hypothetical protein
MRYYGTQNEVKAYLNRLQSETTIQVTPSIVKTLNDRVESLKKSGVWSQYSLGFNDVDADSYFQRASVNDVIGRSEVCWFVRGIKSLGLWQNMVSWPLRSYQNAGTGSTVYSLGGLGTFNGTLNNDIQWDRTGLVTYNGGNGSVSGTFRSISSSNFPIIYFAVNIRNATNYITGIDPLISVGNQNLAMSRRGPTGGTSDDYTIRTSTGLNLNATASGNIPAFRWHTIYSKVDSNFANISVSKGIFSYQQTTSPQTLPATGSNFLLSQRPSSGTGNSIQGFAAIFLNSDINNTLLHDLYRSTVGSGLGLP